MKDIYMDPEMEVVVLENADILTDGGSSEVPGDNIG